MAIPKNFDDPDYFRNAGAETLKQVRDICRRKRKEINRARYLRRYARNAVK